MDIREISIRLKRVQQEKQAAVDAALSELQCSLSQWVILRRISALPGASAHKLAQSAFQTDQSFGAIARRLIDRGLVARTQGHGRSTMHVLTKEGQGLLDACNPIVIATLNSQFGALPDSELRQFNRLLQKILREPVEGTEVERTKEEAV